MKSKGLLNVVGSLCLLSIFSGILLSVPSVPVEAAPAEPVTLTMVSQFPLVSVAINYSTRRFQKYVEEFTGGRVKVDFKGGPEVIAPAEVAKAVERGIFDVCFAGGIFVAGQYPAFQLDNFVNPANHRLAVRDEKIWDLMSRMVRGHGMIYLGNWQNGQPMYSFLSKKPPLDKDGKIESYKGLKIRVGGAQDSDLVKAIGGTPVVLSIAELFEALRSKLVDGTMVPMNSAVEMRLWEITSYAVRDSVYNLSGLGLMNAAKFDKLSPADQRAIMEVAKLIHYASYNYTSTIALDGFASRAAYANVPALYFSDKIKKDLIEQFQKMLPALAAAEPKFSKELIERFGPYFGDKDLPLSTEASLAN